MRATHVGYAAIAAMCPLIAQLVISIFKSVAAIEVSLAVATSLLDLAERKLGLFFGSGA
jgi:lysylphosphatidylglycerol synthetase-like protein (DUF2156 family)